MRISTLHESTFNALCHTEGEINRYIAIHQAAGNLVLVAHLEALIAQVQISKGAALEAAGRPVTK